MSRAIRHTAGVFAALSDDVLGPMPSFTDLRLSRHPAERVALARRVWADRVRTEFRSIQIMNRFLGEVLGAGDPIEVYAGAADLIVDEIRHARLCVALCEALGGVPLLPDPVELRDSGTYLRASMAERALYTAIGMLCVNETISVAFVEDLRDRCDDPAVCRVLDATVADEEGHQEFGWAYVQKALERFPSSSIPSWQELVRRTLEPHRSVAGPVCDRLAIERITLDDLPEPELASLGLFSRERQSLVFSRCFEEVLAPRLRRLGLLVP